MTRRRINLFWRVICATIFRDVAALGRALLGPRPVSDVPPLHKGKAELDFRAIVLVAKREKSDNP
jgi:hypothetical protein